MFGLERGYCLMIGGDDTAVARLDPFFRTLAPGVEAARAHARRARATRPPAEQGYLHCGPAGAGHFVKMVHNGIEYGMMAAYAEGLNILHHADVGQGTSTSIDAETTPLREPELYQYDFDLAEITEVWRRGSVVASWLLDLTAAGAASRAPSSANFSGRVSDSGEGRWTVARGDRRGRAGAGARDRAVHPLRLARRGRVRQQGAVGDALRLRRAPREDAAAAALSRADAVAPRAADRAAVRGSVRRRMSRLRAASGRSRRPRSPSARRGSSPSRSTTRRSSRRSRPSSRWRRRAGSGRPGRSSSCSASPSASRSPT